MMVELQDISKVIMGQSPKGESYNEKGVGIPLLNGAADYKGNSFNPKKFTSHPTRIAKKGDILLGIRATIGNFAFADSDYCIGRGVAALRVDESKADKSYILKCVERELDKIIHKASGSTIKGIKKEDLTEMKINLPPLQTQKRIAQILDNAAALRDKTKQLLGEYDALTQAIFLEMFGDPIFNPKKWEKNKIKNLGKTTTGNTPSRNKSEYYGDFIEWIKTDNINTPETYLTKANEYLSSKGLSVGRSVDEGAILVTCIAGSRRVIGNVAIANRKVAFNQQINAFHPKNNITIFWYYQFVLAKAYVQDFSTNGMKGIITKGKFQEIDFINPPIELQNQFAEKIALIEKQKELAKQELQESEDLFNCLLQKAFKGELV